MIIIIAVVALMVVGAFYIHQLVVTSTQLATPAGIQVTTSTPSIIDLGPEDLSMYVGMVIHNSGGTTATLEEIDYSVYANGAYVGSGRQTALNYTIPRKSYHGLSLPVGMSWGSASSSIGGYFVNGGQLTLEVRGTATVNVNRSTYAVPFDASITLEISAMTGASTSTATSP